MSGHTVSEILTPLKDNGNFAINFIGTRISHIVCVSSVTVCTELNTKWVSLSVDSRALRNLRFKGAVP